MTLYLLSKLQGLATRQHPLLLSGGNQSTSGTSAYVSSCILVRIKSVKSVCGSLLEIYVHVIIEYKKLLRWLQNPVLVPMFQLPFS